MLFNCKNRTKQFLFFIVFINCIFSNYFLISAYPEQKTFVKCTIVYISTCGKCDQIYQSQVRPFYDSYRYNDSIDFTIIDLATDIDLFYQEMQRLELNDEEYGDFPWVIFEWGDNQEQVFDADNLDQVESTFLTILEDSGYIPQLPPSDNGSTVPVPSFSFFNLDFLVISGILTVVGIVITLTGIRYYTIKIQPKELFKRNSAPRVRIIALLSMILIFFLTYQFLEYLQGNCGCLTGDQIIILLFQQYNHANFLGLEIPYALIGIAFMGGVLVQVFLVGTINIPSKINIPLIREISVNERLLQYLHYFLAFQMIAACVAVFYLILIEIYLIDYICLLCTISQIIIVLNTWLIATWKPLSTQ